MPKTPPHPPPPDDKTGDKQLEYCSFDWFQIVLFQNILLSYKSLTISKKE